MNKEYFKALKMLILLLAATSLSSCGSPENKLVGEWSTMFGISESDYTQYRVYRPGGPGSTMIQKFEFTKGSDGKKGTFIDNVFPLIPGDNIVIGSKVTGEWEIKDKKLHLYYDELSLNGTIDKLSEDTQMQLDIEMTEKFTDDYYKVGEAGVPYSIVEKNGKRYLEIDFPDGKVVLSRDKEKK